MILPLVFIFLAFLADRLTKLWAAQFLAANGPTQVHALLTIRETYNRGIALGLFQGIGPIVGWLTVFVVLGMGVYMARLPREQWLARLGLAILIGGALGNLVDRVFVGQVLDFIETPLRPGIFNVADVMIYLGLALVLAGSFLQKGKRDTAVSSFPDLSHEFHE